MSESSTPQPWLVRLRLRWIELTLVLAGLALIYAYRWLLDDAFVYFRYIDNWVLLGRGLVYNDGEYVEGYSSQLWLVLLALPRVFELSHWTSVALWGLVIGAGFLVLAMRVNDKLGAAAPGPAERTRVNLPLAILAVGYGPATYFTGGLETPLVQLAAPIVALYILEPEQPWLRYALALLPLVRPELALPTVLAMLAVRFRCGRWPWPAMILTVSVGLAALGLRIWYYADVVPNTYYVKNGFAWSRGAAYLWDAIRGAQLHVLIPVIIGAHLVLGGLRTHDSQRGARLWMWGIAALSSLYAVRIGGDMVQYRYLAFPICLAVLGFGGWAERWVGVVSAWPPGSWLPRYAPVLSLGVAASSFALHPHYLSGHPLSPETEVIQSRHGVSEALLHRRNSTTTYAVPRAAQEAEQIARYPELVEIEPAKRPVFAFRNCVGGYTYMDSYIVNSYGLTEPILAHADAAEKRVGHRNLTLPAADIRNLHRALRPFGRGSYRVAVEQGIAQAWVEHNLDSIEEIEARVFNQHDFVENLGLALRPVPSVRLTKREKQYKSGWK